MKSIAIALASLSLFASAAQAQLRPSILDSYLAPNSPVGNINTPGALFGSTRVALGSVFVGALGSLGVTPGVIFPTTIEGGVANFPIESGILELATAKGEINHSGGLTLSAGGTTVRLTSFLIDTTGAAPVITGLVAANDAVVGRIPLFNLIPEGLTLPLSAGAGALRGVRVELNETAAGALNAVFGVTAFTAGFPIGTAEVNVFSAGG
jgi:hypothetical protein